MGFFLSFSVFAAATGSLEICTVKQQNNTFGRKLKIKTVKYLGEYKKKKENEDC